MMQKHVNDILLHMQKKLSVSETVLKEIVEEDSSI